MKSIFLFCSKIWVYLTEIPLMIMLFIAIELNDESKDIFGYYPLIIFLSLAILFIAVYFFRVITVSTDEIKFHGLFSSRDREFIKKDRSLVISIKPHHTLRLELYGDAGEEPAFDWMRAEDVVHRDICLFRGNAVGGAKSALKILRYFGVSREAEAGYLGNGYFFEDQNVKVYTEIKNELTCLTVKFKTTIV